MINRPKKKLGKELPSIAKSYIKYLGVNLTQQVKDLYDSNFKSLKKSNKISENGEIAYAHGLPELT